MTDLSLTPKVLYHVRDHQSRDSILARGLNNLFSGNEIWSNCDEWNDGTYTWEDFESARHYRDHVLPVSGDIYQIEVKGLELLPDQSGSKGFVVGAWHISETVSPDQITLIERFEELDCFERV